MRKRLATVIAVSALAFAGGAVSPAHHVGSPDAAYAKSCGAGYVHAVLSWGHKCLRAGQFCKVGNREYRKYGFVCPASGHLRRR
jgi:hypothetical protein